MARDTDAQTTTPIAAATYAWPAPRPKIEPNSTLTLAAPFAALADVV